MADRLVRCEIDGGCSTFRRRQEERSQQSGDRPAKSGLPVNTHVRGNGSRMTAVYRDPSALQPRCQLSGKQDIGKLALGVGRDHIVTMVKIDIVEMNPAHFMSTGSNIYDPGPGGHPVKQKSREQEMPQMIDPELSLDPVLRFLPL